MPTHPRETQKIPSPGHEQVHDFRSDVSPSSRQAAQIFQEKGVTQLQNTKLLAMGGLGNKRGEFCGGTRQQKRQRDVLKRSLVEIRLLAGGRGGIGPDPEGTLHLTHAGTAHPQRERRQSCTPPKKRGGGRGRGGDAGEDHCHLHLAGTDPAKPNGGAQVWGVAASPWFPLRYPSRTERRPPWMVCPPGGSSCWRPLWAPRRPRRGW